MEQPLEIPRTSSQSDRNGSTGKLPMRAQVQFNQAGSPDVPDIADVVRCWICAWIRGFACRVI